MICKRPWTMQNMKVVVIGDGGVGKTSLLITYATNNFPTVYIPTQQDFTNVKVMVDGTSVNTSLWDTAGGEDYHRLRFLSYRETDVFFICFSVESHYSLEHVETYWLPEVRHYCPNDTIVLVATKTDLRCAWTGPTLSYDEGYAVAKRNGLGYSETSALTQSGLKECIENALRTCLRAPRDKGKKGAKRFDNIKRKSMNPTPPRMPQPDAPPTINIEPSTFGDDWYKMLQDPTHSDVTFVLEGKHRVDAHTLVICSASDTFAKIFGVAKACKSGQNKQINAIDNYTTDQLNSGQVSGIAALYHSDGKGPRIVPHTTVEISADISVKTFMRILEFLYTGTPKFADCDDDVIEEKVQDLERVAGIFNLPPLQIICTKFLCANILLGQKVPDGSSATSLNEKTGARMKQLFFNQPDRADVVFNVDGTQVYAHRCVLVARSDVMAAMFSGNFAESRSNKTEIHIPNTTAESLLAVLEYLYTDHSPIEDSDSVGIMVLSDQYGLRRLVNLCEMTITKEVFKKVANQVEKSEIDVIDLLHTSQTYNASQLAKWCLFFIASNYTAFQEHPEFSKLTGDNKTYIEANRWPPLRYLQWMDYYATSYGRQDEENCTEHSQQRRAETRRRKCTII